MEIDNLVLDNKCTKLVGVIDKSITNVTIPGIVEEIGNNAFFGCDSLMTVVIPSSVKEIGMDSFAYISSLKKIHCEISNPKKVKLVLSSFNKTIYDNCTLIIPPETYWEYSHHKVFGKFKNIMPRQFPHILLEKWENAKTHKARITREELILMTDTDEFSKWWNNHKNRNGSIEDYYIYKTNRLFLKRLLWLLFPLFLVYIGVQNNLNYIIFIWAIILIVVFGVLILSIPYKEIGSPKRFSNFDCIYLSVILLSATVFTIYVNWDDIKESINRKIEAPKEVKKEKNNAEVERSSLVRKMLEED